MLLVKIVIVTDNELKLLLLLRSILKIKGILIMGIAENTNDMMKFFKDQCPDIVLIPNCSIRKR